ncbi:acyltransferase [Intrasporangium sp. YIM S08009]|uniref:acyltransferase family protein n=1 Tax=Intrasporangium zincisolvens TaxID=3080018 RepID=UPI002B060F36|nr:acyltransferase [Intrasporangium sp. YIM S08009]
MIESRAAHLGICQTYRYIAGHPERVQGTHNRWRLGRRPALDGVRGVAILLVLARHGGLPLESAGSVGVALFFGLSGFLITELLLEEFEKDRTIRFRAFYARRVRRLLPALVVSIAAVALAGVFLGPRFFTWHHAVAALFYVGNWVLVSGLSLSSLTHTWSLAVEEQFYLVWPLVVWFMARRGRRAVMLAAGLGVALALVWFVWAVATGVPWYRIYFSTEAACLSLLTGAATAAWMGRRSAPIVKSRLRYAGWVLIIVGAALPEIATITVTPVTTAVAVALVLPSAAGSSDALLEMPILRWFGERSYSIYLWNGPSATWLREEWHWPWWALLLVVIPSGVALGALSYRWVEAPFRRRRGALGASRDGSAHGPGNGGPGADTRGVQTGDAHPEPAL